MQSNMGHFNSKNEIIYLIKHWYKISHFYKSTRLNVTRILLLCDKFVTCVSMKKILSCDSLGGNGMFFISSVGSFSHYYLLVLIKKKKLFVILCNSIDEYVKFCKWWFLVEFHRNEYNKTKMIKINFYYTRKLQVCIMSLLLAQLNYLI